MTISTTYIPSGDKVEPLPVEEWPNVDELVTEDEKPVDNVFSAKQQRLLVESLYSSWDGGSQRRKFLVDSNIGMFYSVRQPPLVPDVFLSLDVELPADLQLKRHRSYFFWEYGKPPEVVTEIVSNKEGNEDTDKLRDYARLHITYYVIHDPFRALSDEALRVYEWHPSGYALMSEAWLPQVELGLTLWRGVYEGWEDEWLRWCDRQGNVIPTGAERVQRLEAQLRALGVEPK